MRISEISAVHSGAIAAPDRKKPSATFTTDLLSLSSGFQRIQAQIAEGAPAWAQIVSDLREAYAGGLYKPDPNRTAKSLLGNAFGRLEPLA